ncbi:70 kDa peptidyl-prolyl isomerase-like [Thrips palmi]|uniref:70 kDa peptidyl-prolyl isomerase-like n=1 Tax=Thrips palmi TaxID=161013 RepID=A0A6P8YE62_THRPL|nr:70 kDa peptidyl-prolyl isomerase-like [Thrips palmi]XP_034237992.1 70 kDa peptidyl-prolyl isomerase-like [Thrips palmi]XP_034237993.1 70 kDa peptidyl-prolyl isomerase-like [Thrips palmi]XP_034237994.1 70 kDa peptidyl-prolyl isomerase-like [Thrips palmi]
MENSPLSETVIYNQGSPFREEELISKVIPQTTLYDTYVSKTILSPGIKGLRPHVHSTCTFVVESLELLDTDFSQVVKSNSMFSTNIDHNLELGSCNSEIDKALELVLLDMNEGERSEVILSATKREGKLRDQFILPVPCIKCVINLGKVTELPKHKKSSLPSNNYLLSILNASTEEKLEMALNDKSCGVDLFKNERYVDAFHRFALGVKILLTVDMQELTPSLQTLLSTLCSNMAECQLKENNPTMAVSLCAKALHHDPSNVKALYRQASASWALGDTDQADLLLQRLLQLDPNNLSAKRLNCEVQVKIKKYKDEYSKMMKRIFSS